MDIIKIYKVKSVFHVDKSQICPEWFGAYEIIANRDVVCTWKCLAFSNQNKK